MSRPSPASRSNLLTIFVVLFCAATVFAEDNIYGSLQIGMNLGRFSTSGPQENRRGLVFGGGIEIPVGGNYFIQPEVNYIEKGGKSDLNSINTSGVADIYIKYDFVDIPVLFKARYGESDLRVELLGGPYVGFALSKALVVEPVSGSATSTNLNFGGTDYGAILGLGVDFKISSDSWFYFTGRYIYGLANIVSATTTGASSSVTAVNNRGIMMAFGYKIQI